MVYRMKATTLFLTLCAMTMLAGCSEKKKDTQRPPVAVKVITIGSASYDNAREYVGTVEEKNATVLSFEVAGNITAVKADEGDHVKQGQLLAVINPATLNNTHRAALATLNQARDAYRRMKNLHAQGTVSDIKWVEVETKLHQAEAAERIAREQLGHTTLRAPASGVIASRDVQRGSNVLPGQQVMKLVDVSTVYVKVSVPENEITSIQIGRRAAFRVAALGNTEFYGTVKEKGVTANPLSHTYDVKIQLSNPGGRLMPGMVCSVRMQQQAASGQVVVPAGCVQLDTDNSRFVWIVQNGKAVRRSIVTGDFEGDGVVVLSGLAPGESLIVAGQQKVSDGMKVKQI